MASVEPVRPEAFFLAAKDGGQRFCTYHGAYGPCRGAVVYVHPFAEEMNKARRMAALQSRALAEAGYSVLQIDLLGCGDSSGDFDSATWQSWVCDVVLAVAWIRARTQTPAWIWGLRAGALIAADAARMLEAPFGLLLWQPATLGKLVLQQFLRLKVMAGLTGNGRDAMSALRSRLAAGEHIEIAGYSLSPELANDLERVSLQPCATVTRLEWIELSARADGSLSPMAVSTIAAWKEQGCSTRSQVVAGPAFWQTSEIEVAPALLTATLASLQSAEQA